MGINRSRGLLNHSLCVARIVPVARAHASPSEPAKELGTREARWAWFAQVDAEGRPFIGGSGHADDGRGAREVCEALLPLDIRAAVEQ